MPLVRSVFSKALWERRISILYWLAGFAAMGALMVAVYPAFRDSAALKEFLARFPPAMMSMLGIDPTNFTTGIGFVQAQLYSFVAPIVLIAFTVPVGAAATAREEEDGTADLLLAYPIRRSRVVIEAFLALALWSALLAGVLAAFLFLGNAAVDLRLPPGGILGINLGLWLLGLFFGGLTMTVGAWLGKPRLAMGVGAGFALITFFIQGLAPVVKSLQPLQPFTPFYWFQNGDPARNGPTAGHVVLAAAVLVLLAGAVVLFRLRDIRTDPPLVRGGNRKGPGRLDGLLRSVYGKELWERRVTIWIWTTALCAVTAATIAFWPTLAGSGPEQLEQLLKLVPKEVFAAFGISDPATMLTPAGFLTARIYATIGLVVMVIFAIAFATAKQPLELMLATPLQRTRLMTSRFAAMATLIGVQALFLLLTVAIGSHILDFGLRLGPMLAANAGLALLALFFGALAMCFGRGTAAAVAVGAFVFNGLGAAIEALGPLRTLSPVYWFLADTPPLLRGFAPGMLATLLGTLVLYAAAVMLFARRDVPA
jgi:ABC-2 type transport system permease protein